MSELKTPEGMTRVGEEYEITDSKDSGWKEWFSGTYYYLNQVTGDILAVDYDGFDNTRNNINWEKETGRRTVSPEQVPEKVRGTIKELLAKK